MKFQSKPWACGPFAVLNAARALGKHASARQVIKDTGATEKHGTQVGGIMQAIERLGMRGQEITGGDSFDAMRGVVTGGGAGVLCVDGGEHWIALIGHTGSRVIVFDSARTLDNMTENGVHLYTRSQLHARLGAERFWISMERERR